MHEGNIVGYAAMLIRDWDYHSWSLGVGSSLSGISFVVKYMAISLVLAVVIPFVLSFSSLIHW